MALRSRFSAVSLFFFMLPCLASALDISGIVVDEQDKPLAGVRVAAGEAGPSADEAKLVEAVTDAEGRFVIKGVPDSAEIDYLAVEAFMPGRTTQSEFVGPTDRKPLKMKLLKARAVTIQLLDLQGKPAPGIGVAEADAQFPGHWGLIIQTDTNGKVTFPGAPESGVYDLCVSDSRFVHSDISVRVPEDDGAKFKVVPGGFIEGKLVDHAGKPIAGASVNAMADQLGFWGGYGGAKTDSAGRFRIARLDSGDYFISVDPKPSYAIVPIKCKVERGKVTQLGVIKAPIPGTIVGKVVDDETGKPVEGIDIQYTPEIWPSGWGGDRAQSDKDGSFKILGLGTVSAVPYVWSHPVYKEAASSVEFQKLTMKSGQVTDYSIRLKKTPPPRFDEQPALEPAKSLNALVLDENGHGVAGCRLRLFGYDSSKKSLLKDELATGETDQHGSMSIDVPKGEAFVWLASKPGYADVWNGTNRFVSDPVVLRLFKAAPIRGQLVNEAGKAVPNARITARAVSGYCYTGRTTLSQMRVDLEQLTGNAPSTVTDGKGMFTLSGTPTKFVTLLEVSHPGYLKLTQPVSLPAGQVKLTALRPAVLKGKLTVNYPSLASIPLAVKVQWHGDYEGEALAPVKADGTFEIPNALPPRAKELMNVYARASLCIDPDRKSSDGLSMVADPRCWPFQDVLEIRKPNGRTAYFGLGMKGVDLSGKRSLEVPVISLLKISGIVYGKDGKPAPGLRIMYQGAAAVEGLGPGAWRVADVHEDGRWAIFARNGNIRIAVDDKGTLSSQQDFKSSASAALHEIVFDLSKPPSKEATGSGQYVTAHIRILDKKGVAVPGPLMKCEGRDVGVYHSGCGLDGTVDIAGTKGSLAKLTSVFLKKPQYFTLTKEGEWKTITFDYDQPYVPTAAESKSIGMGFG